MARLRRAMLRFTTRYRVQSQKHGASKDPNRVKRITPCDKSRFLTPLPTAHNGQVMGDAK